MQWAEVVTHQIEVAHSRGGSHPEKGHTERGETGRRGSCRGLRFADQTGSPKKDSQKSEMTPGSSRKSFQKFQSIRETRATIMKAVLPQRLCIKEMKLL